MTAIFLAVILIVGYHFESQHPLRRLKLVRQTGYNLYPLASDMRSLTRVSC